MFDKYGWAFPLLHPTLPKAWGGFIFPYQREKLHAEESQGMDENFLGQAETVQKGQAQSELQWTQAASVSMSTKLQSSFQTVFWKEDDRNLGAVGAGDDFPLKDGWVVLEVMME